MIAASGLTSITAAGCFSSAALPPETSLPRYSRRVMPRPHRKPADPQPSRPQPPETHPSRQNPWEPNATERDWKYIVLHHTATSGGSVESIDEAHSNRRDADGDPWLGIGYHFLIGNGNGMPDGAIEPTFRWQDQIHGAHAGRAKYNQFGIGIALVGNFQQSSPSPAQIEAVEGLVATLREQYGIRPGNIVGHNAIKSTACPGRHFPVEEVRHAQGGFRARRRLTRHELRGHLR